jgi:hypothetical protein
MCAADCRLPLRRNMAKTIAGYVAKGLKVVKVYRPVAVDVCSCSEGARCSSPGKHPIGLSWAENAATTSEETVMDWWEDDHTAPNVGVVLGPVYGVAGRPVIDVEPDTEEGIGVIRELGLEYYETPTYDAGKSPHRLLGWEEGLPMIGAFTYRGVEVRLGNTGMEQSVLPPSVHTSGRSYGWRDGFSLDDIEIAPIPPALRQWIMEAWEARSREDGTGGRGGRSLEILRRKHLQANRERHRPLMSFAGFLARSVRVGNVEEEGLFLDVLHAVNARQCVPPNPDGEVNDIWRYALKYRQQDLAEATACDGVSMLTDGGSRRFVPAGLELTIVKSDPPSYRLFCEAWRKFNGTGVANLSAEDFMSAKKTAVALAAQVGGLRLDRWPGDWSRIWDGKAGRAKTSRSEGARPATVTRPTVRPYLSGPPLSTAHSLSKTMPDKVSRDRAENACPNSGASIPSSLILACRFPAGVSISSVMESPSCTPTHRPTTVSPSGIEIVLSPALACTTQLAARRTKTTVRFWGVIGSYSRGLLLRCSTMIRFMPVGGRSPRGQHHVRPRITPSARGVYATAAVPAIHEFPAAVRQSLISALGRCRR